MRALRPAALRIGRPGLAAGAPARLDHPGGVAAVLGATLALRVGHCARTLVAPRCSPGCGSARARASPRRRRAAPGRRARPRATRRVALDGLEQRARSGSASWSSTLQETCATSPRAASVSPMARRPGSPCSPPSRMARAMRRASSSVAVGPSSRLKATSGGRAATSTAPAVGCSARGAEVGRRGRRPCAARARRPRRGAARRACARRPGRRRGRRAGRARRARRRARAPRRARRRAARACGRRRARRRSRRRAGAAPRGA